MSDPGAAVVALASAYAEMLQRIAVPTGFEGGIEHVVANASDPVLLEAVRANAQLLRVVQAEQARLAAEVSRRSAANEEASLARRLGERNAAAVVAREAGLDPASANTLVKVGESVAPRRALTGEPLPPRRQHLALALDHGAISIAVADLIEATLRKVEAKLSGAQLETLEARLIAVATSGIGVAEFRRFCARVPDAIDPDGATPREEELRKQAALREVRLPNGVLRVIVDLHPEIEGLWRSAIDAKTAPRRVRFVDESEYEYDKAATDGRTTAQRRLDALATILRQSLQHDDGDVAGTAVTMVVTCDLEALRAGIGSATIAGVEQPISAKTARRLAVNARIIPQVLGGASEVLDQGEGRRLFSPAQRIALATRDGGCVWPDCEAPPSWCEVAHLKAWYLGGLTDLDNGALLCAFHHHRLDNDGWELQRRRGELWLIPPPWVDPARRPRRAGRPAMPHVA